LTLFQKYKSWLVEKGLYDIRFATSEIFTAEIERQYDLIVVDEAQDLSPSALMYLYGLADTPLFFLSLCAGTLKIWNITNRNDYGK
jgi:hypothetical protein